MMRKGSAPSGRSVFSNSNAGSLNGFNVSNSNGNGPESILVEIDLHTHTFGGQSSQVLIIRNVSKYLEMLSNETKSYLDLTWLDMLA